MFGLVGEGDPEAGLVRIDRGCEGRSIAEPRGVRVAVRVRVRVRGRS